MKPWIAGWAQDGPLAHDGKPRTQCARTYAAETYRNCKTINCKKQFTDYLLRTHTHRQVSRRKASQASKERTRVDCRYNRTLREFCTHTHTGEKTQNKSSKQSRDKSETRRDGRVRQMCRAVLGSDKQRLLAQAKVPEGLSTNLGNI